MRVFFDENMPRALRHVLDGHTVSFVERTSWKGKQNGELLRLVAAEFDVLLSSDGSIAFQQNLIGLTLSVIVVPTPNLTLLRANAVAIRLTLDELEPLGYHAIVTIDWRGRRTLRRVGQTIDEERVWAPVELFSRR